MNKFYITTSIAYTNAGPHIGFALELMQADTVARFYRYLGKDVHFLTGTDEHGLKIYKKAKEEGKEPKVFVDEITSQYKKLIESLNISNDDFIRTTDKERHWPGVKAAWEKMEKAGDIYKKNYKGKYCVGCEAFKKEKELAKGRCPDHDREPEIIEEENYFFKLSKYSGKVKEAVEKGDIEVIPESRKNETLRFLEEDVEDISVSRSRKNLSWGIPVPGDKNQTVYVWVDALSNYITALGYGKEEERLKKYWPADVHCVGKDISRFHCVIWPGILLSLGLSLPERIFVHGFMTVEGKKMSKSLGNVIDPFELVEKYGTDPVRYYFLREVPTSGDGDFSKERFQERYNADLADGIGNLTSRVLAMARKRNCLISREEIDFSLSAVEEAKEEIHSLIKEFRLNEALNSIWKVVHFADGYIEEKKPWEGGEDSERTLKELICILYFLADHLSFFLPETAKKMEEQIRTGKKDSLFPKIREE